MIARLSVMATLLSIIGMPHIVNAAHGGDGQLNATTADNWGERTSNGSMWFSMSAPAGATNVEIRITEGSNTGDADLYVWDQATYDAGPTTANYTCRPWLAGSTETCSLAAGETYYAAVLAYSSFTDVGVSGDYSVAGASSSASTSGTTHIEFYRDNLFLGIAYHRIGCATDYSTIMSDRDFDGFSDGNYCRKGETWEGPMDHGASAWMAAHKITTSDPLATMEACGTATNDVYGTTNYSRRSDSNHVNYCSYNILTDCNSDCWIAEFASCMGVSIDTLSPCW